MTPFRNTLIEMVDFDRLNDGPTRVSVVAVDVETGEEVISTPGTSGSGSSIYWPVPR